MSISRQNTVIIVFIGIILGLTSFLLFHPQHRQAPSEYLQNDNGFIHAEGNQLVDSNGNKIILKGFNMGFVGTMLAYKNLHNRASLGEIDSINDEKIKNLFTEWDFKNMRNIGANSFRIFLRFYQFETNPYQYDDGLLKTYDYLVNTGSKHGIFTVITLCWAGQNKPENINNGLGNKLWFDKNLRQRVIATWEHLAEHYKNNSGVAAYDILNEPTAPDKESLHSFYADAIKAIRKHDQNHLIILERESMAQTPQQRNIHWAGEYSDPNLMFEDHYYNDAAGHKYADASVPLPPYDSKEAMQKRLQWDIQKSKTKPIYIGEFGALWRSGQEGIRWTRNLLEIMSKYGFSWSYFPYKKIVHQEGNIRGLYASKKSLPTLKPQYISHGKLTPGYLRLLHTQENYQENLTVRQLLNDAFLSSL